jgi:Mg2+ and Co2+ transporter CorA
MIKEYKNKELTWIDLTSPSLEEVRTLMGRYALDPRVAEDLMTPSLKPKVDLYKDYIYLILHFPALHHSQVNPKKRGIRLDPRRGPRPDKIDARKREADPKKKGRIKELSKKTPVAHRFVKKRRHQRDP